ncbi:MAG TPA: response regulator transcription factor [Gemmatimonadales bacterium]|jgi:DNA-binding NarL/FixJ family response regulator
MPKPRLLIADDHEMVSQGLKALLGDTYNIVGAVRDGREVIDAVGRYRPDVLLLDLSLPNRTGIDLIPEIRALHESTRILVVTMHVDAVLAGLAMRLGAHGFVPKDSGVQELNEAIAEVLAGRTYVSPRIPIHTHKGSWGGTHMGFGQLTPRQQAIVRLTGRGRNSEEIAEAIGISVHTVHFHRRNIRRVLGLHSEAEFMRYALMVQLSAEAGGSGSS